MAPGLAISCGGSGRGPEGTVRDCHAERLQRFPVADPDPDQPIGDLLFGAFPVEADQKTNRDEFVDRCLGQAVAPLGHRAGVAAAEQAGIIAGKAQADTRPSVTGFTAERQLSQPAAAGLNQDSAGDVQGQGCGVRFAKVKTQQCHAAAPEPEFHRFVELCRTNQGAGDPSDMRQVFLQQYVRRQFGGKGWGKIQPLYGENRTVLLQDLLAGDENAVTGGGRSCHGDFF